MRVSEHPILGPAPRARLVTIYCDGRPIQAVEGEPVAAALLAAGVHAMRTTPKRGEPRGVFCAIGRGPGRSNPGGGAESRATRQGRPYPTGPLGLAAAPG